MPAPITSSMAKCGTSGASNRTDSSGSMTSTQLRQGRLLAVLVAFALVFLGQIIWQVLARSDSGGDTPIEKAEKRRHGIQPGGSVPVVDHVSRLQRGAFSLFLSPPEGLPPRVTKALHRPSYGMSWVLAQRIPGNSDADFWAVPGRGAICIVGQEKVGIVTVNCGTTRHAASHGIAAVLLREDPASPSLGPPRGQRLVFGLAPDGFASLRVYTKGSFTQVPVKNGTFTLRDAVMEPPTEYRPSRG
jgi:hypothetical protein